MGNSTHYQPDTASLIGGYPSTFDIVPSVLIGAGYVISLLALAFRQLRPSTRIILPMLHTFLFAVEHAIILFLRVGQAHKTVYNYSVFYTYWCQMTFAIGWLNLIMAMVGFMRELTTNATLADECRGSVDRPEERKRYRRMAGLFSLGSLASIIVGVIGAGSHGVGVHASFVITFRYASTLIALAVLLVFIWKIMAIKRTLAFIDQDAVQILFYMCIIILIVPLYRLAVMYNTTPNLPGTATPDPSVGSSLSSNAAKTAFYICHLLPELVVTLWLHVIDCRATFNTSVMGDRAWNDKKGIPRLRERGQLVEGVGVEFTKVAKPSDRVGPYQGANAAQQDSDHVYASLLVPETSHYHAQERQDPWGGR